MQIQIQFVFATQIQFYKEIHQFNSKICHFPSLIWHESQKIYNVTDFLKTFFTKKKRWKWKNHREDHAIECVCQLLYLLNETFWNENFDTDCLKLLLWNSLSPDPFCLSALQWEIVILAPSLHVVKIWQASSKLSFALAWEIKHFTLPHHITNFKKYR